MEYFIVPHDGGYRIVGSDGKRADFSSPWFETYSLAEKHIERLNKRAEQDKTNTDKNSPHTN